MVVAVGRSTPLGYAQAVAARAVKAKLTVSCAAKPLPETVTRLPQFAVAGVTVRAAFGVGVAVAVGVGIAVAVAVGVGVAVAVAVGVGVAVAVAVGVSVAVAVAVGISV